MHCPFCNQQDTQVKDSRPTEDGSVVRRRRACEKCGGRFTTFERIQLREVYVLKNDGTRQLFDREKMKRSVKLAMRKRPFDDHQIDELISTITRRIEIEGEQDISSSQIGEILMKHLALLDNVAYVRFASVYRDFSEVNDFKNFINNTIETPQKK